MLFPAWRGRGRLLDVGCGNGSYLSLMRTLGWDVAGVDVDPQAVAVCRARGLSVFLWAPWKKPASQTGPLMLSP